MFVLDNTNLPQSELPGIRHKTLAGSEHGLPHLSVWPDHCGRPDDSAAPP